MGAGMCGRPRVKYSEDQDVWMGARYRRLAEGELPAPLTLADTCTMHGERGEVLAAAPLAAHHNGIRPLLQGRIRHRR